MHRWQWETYFGVLALAVLLLATVVLLAPDSVQFLQLQTNKILFDADAIIALFTLILTIVAILQFLNNKRQLSHHEKVERAFVKMSHNAPGLVLDGRTRIVVSVQIKNLGRTPARITDVVLEIQIAPNVARQNNIALTSPQSGVDVFLVADDHFNHRKVFTVEVADVRDSAMSTVLMGHVDYVDIFGKRHRSGYARQYRADVDLYEQYNSDEEYRNRNNLYFLVGNRYNYDRRRMPGEGYDWGEVQA